MKAELIKSAEMRADAKFSSLRREWRYCLFSRIKYDLQVFCCFFEEKSSFKPTLQSTGFLSLHVNVSMP